MTRFVAATILSAIAMVVNAPAFAQSYPPSTNCKNCVAPRPHYDTQEVVRTTKDVDVSRVINTQSVVPVSQKVVRTHNHLVIRKNQIRKVGVIQHNHTIIEKEIRYVRRKPAVRYGYYAHARPITVNFVTQQYRTTHRPAKVFVPYVYPQRRVLHVRG